MTIHVRNPATGEVLATYEEMSATVARQVVDDVAVAARTAWGRSSLETRRDRLLALADELTSHRELAAVRMALEMGKPFAQGRREIEKCVWVCRHFASVAQRVIEPRAVPTDAAKSYVVSRPLGVVLGVMAWDFPFWQVFRFLVPALLAGNGVVLKHARSVTGCALEIEEIVRAAGFPENLMRVVLVDDCDVESLIAHDAIGVVTVTGSAEAGRAVAAAAGRHIKKSVLELGGSDPYIILADADVEHAARVCAASRLDNTGQSRIAAKRFLVVRDVEEAFLEHFVTRMEAATIGDPLRGDPDLGPMARRDLRDRLHEQVVQSVEQGAEIVTGGRRLTGPGAFYPPTVLTGVTAGMPAADEELFGPVAAVQTVSDQRCAIEVANASRFGLGAAVFTRDLERGERIARDELDAGCCFVNAAVKADPRLPFGGIKHSGYGRELGDEGVREFVNTKTVWIDGSLVRA